MAKTIIEEQTGPVFDPTSVKLSETTDIPARTRVTSGPGKYDNNPFVQPVLDSYQSGTVDDKGVFRFGVAKEATVPGKQVAELTQWIRNAGAQAELGTSLVYTWTEKDDSDGDPYETYTRTLSEVPDDDTPVTVKFYGKPRKTRQVKTNGDTSESNES